MTDPLDMDDDALRRAGAYLGARIADATPSDASAECFRRGGLLVAVLIRDWDGVRILLRGA